MSENTPLKKDNWLRCRTSDCPEIVEVGPDDDPVIRAVVKEFIQHQTDEYDYFAELWLGEDSGGWTVVLPPDLTALVEPTYQWSEVYSTPLTTDTNRLTGYMRNGDSVAVARTEKYTYWCVTLGGSPLMSGYSQFVRVPCLSEDFHKSPEMQTLRDESAKRDEKQLEEWIKEAEG